MPVQKPETGYYLESGVMTTPGSYRPLFADLPRDIADLAAVAHGLLIHEHIAGAYRVTLTPERRARPVRVIAELLARPEVDLVHLRNVGYGCYNLAVRATG